MQRVALNRPLSRLSTPALMSLLVQGVGFYFASRPMLERIGAGHEIEASHLDAQVTAFAEFILAALLPAPVSAAPRSCAQSRPRSGRARDAGLRVDDADAIPA
jgi:hypothetical protein